MIVVADTSPLIVLVNIGHIQILPRLFGRVIIPVTVHAELQLDRRPALVRSHFSSLPEWLELRVPATLLSIPKLDPGEIAALSLAVELRADLVLVDERKTYRAAVERRIAAVGTIRVLEHAAEAGLIDLASAFESIKRTDFWLAQGFLDERLRLHLAKRGHK